MKTAHWLVQHPAVTLFSLQMRSVSGPTDTSSPIIPGVIKDCPGENNNNNNRGARKSGLTQIGYAGRPVGADPKRAPPFKCYCSYLKYLSQVAFMSTTYVACFAISCGIQRWDVFANQTSFYNLWRKTIVYFFSGHHEHGGPQLLWYAPGSDLFCVLEPLL